MIFKLTIRCGQRCMFCDSSTQIASIQCRTDSPSNWKRLPNCPNQHFSYLPHNSEFQSWYKTRQINSEVQQHPIHSDRDLRLRAGCLTAIKLSLHNLVPRAFSSKIVEEKALGTRLISPVSGNDVTRSPGYCQRDSRAETRGWRGGSIIEPCESIEKSSSACKVTFLLSGNIPEIPMT